MGAGAPDQVYAPTRAALPEITEAGRALVARCEARRIALLGDQQQLRARYEEVMRWVNPPWDPVGRVADPRPEAATAQRDGRNVLHVDLVGQVVDRWAALEMGAAPIFRCKPKYVSAPDPTKDPGESESRRKQYDLERAIAQNQSTQIENATNEWMDLNDFHRTLLWASWTKRAFGKAILRTGWDEAEGIPTCELLENPSQVYYGWSKRYGRRRLAWTIVLEQLDPFEIARRFGINIPTDSYGAIDLSAWTGLLDVGEMDQQAEQSEANQRFAFVEEYWELHPDGSGCTYALIIAGRVIETEKYPWKRLPFHVLENSHIPTYAHGKSSAEQAIALNRAWDTMLDRQADVIEFEAGPRYKGLNMANSGDEVDIPDPFEMVPLREGEDIAQIDTRVDFFPTQLHADHLLESLHRETGLTPIAWGMSPNAQTSGRALSAEWRAVELPLTSALINAGPVIRDVWTCWWDYAEEYSATWRKIAKGYRRFEPIWTPLDIRDQTEQTLDIIQRLNGGLIDPETAISETGKENVDEIMARIKSYYTDPVYNPLRYQQLLTLQQLELSIRQQELQTQQMEQQAAAAQQQQPAPEGGGAPGDLQAQGEAAALQGAQGAGGPVTEAQNQPGTSPGGGGLPIDTSVLSQTPLQGGIGDRAIVDLGKNGQSGSPTSGVQVR